MKENPPVPEIPGYTILGVLGTGGMGIVYKARQLHPDRIVAIKFMLNGRTAEFEELARFRIEAGAVACLSHPSIVLIHEVAVHDGYPYLSLEFVHGGSLRERIGNAPQRPRWSARIAKGIADGVGHAHKNGILHRDLKPDNILIADDDVPKITDFGLAKFRNIINYEQHFDLNATIHIPYFDVPWAERKELDGESAEQPDDLQRRLTTIWENTNPILRQQGGLSLDEVVEFAEEAKRQRERTRGLPREPDPISVPGIAKGTPSYMAPEQFQGLDHQIGPHTDVYGVGCILYEMLTGSPPFSARNMYRLQREVLTKPVPPIVGDVAVDLQQICLKCLEKKPVDRYPDGSALAEDLARFLDGRLVRAAPISVETKQDTSGADRPDADAQTGAAAPKLRPLPSTVPAVTAPAEAVAPGTAGWPLRPKRASEWIRFAGRVLLACVVYAALPFVVVFSIIGIIFGLIVGNAVAFVMIAGFGLLVGVLLGCGNALVAVLGEIAHDDNPVAEEADAVRHSAGRRRTLVVWALAGAAFGLGFGSLVRWMLAFSDPPPSEPLEWKYVLVIAAGWAAAGALAGAVSHPQTTATALHRSLGGRRAATSSRTKTAGFGSFVVIAIVIYIARVLFALGDQAEKSPRSPVPQNQPSLSTLVRTLPKTARIRMYQELEQRVRADIERNPDNLAAYYNLGVALEGQGRLEEAAEAFQRAAVHDARMGDDARARLEVITRMLENR